MYPLDIGLGFSVIKEAYESYATGILLHEIGQHRIILSRNISNYYLQMSSSYAWKDRLMMFISTIGNVDTRHVKANLLLNESFADAKEEIVACVSRTPMRFLISDNNEFADFNLDNINLTTKEDIESKNIECLFNWFVLPVVRPLRDGEPCNKYVEWLGHLFENEKTIIIVDPYLLSQSNLESFIRTLLPKIPQETKIDIYCGKGRSTDNTYEHKDYTETAISIINNLNKNQNRRISVNWCTYKNNMHDRFIILSGCEIGITGGWSVLNIGKLINSGGSEILVTKEIRHSLPEVCEISGLGIQGVKKIESQPLPNKRGYFNNELISLIGSEVTVMITEIIPKGGANGMINDKYKASVPSKWLKDSDIQTGQEVLAIVMSVNENKCIVKPV